jgi:hypothetical protein
MSLNPQLFERMPYDPENDFAPEIPKGSDDKAMLDAAEALHAAGRYQGHGPFPMIQFLDVF